MAGLSYKVLVTTSGTGSRLGDLTKNQNKALLEINGRATIAYVLDSYNPKIPIVITLGYLGDQVREFMLREFPDRQLEFVTVDPYEGPGSSLGYSISCAREKLECPFIFHACDTILIEPIPAPDRNWLGGYIPPQSEWESAPIHYRTHKVRDGKVVKVNDKSVKDFNSIHIGLSGIHNYKIFWKALDEVLKNPKSDSDVFVIEKMLSWGVEFDWVPYQTWLDTGNPQALQKTVKFLTRR